MQQSSVLQAVSVVNDASNHKRMICCVGEHNLNKTSISSINRIGLKREHFNDKQIDFICYLNYSKSVYIKRNKMEEVQRHSVHTLVFRSLKRSHDMFVSNQSLLPEVDDEL